MSTGETLILGAIAGFTIYVGLPMGRLGNLSLRVRASLSAVATGILVFLFWDVVSHGVAPVESRLEAHSWGPFAGYAALLRRLHEDQDDVIYVPAFERDREQPVAGSVPIPRSVRLVVTEGNYLLLEQGDWTRVRGQLDEVWFCDLDAAERVRRLINRHERFGKEHAAAVAWLL